MRLIEQRVSGFYPAGCEVLAILFPFFEMLKNEVRITYVLSKPKYGLVRHLVDVDHDTNLPISLLDVLLVYTKGIDPKEPWFVFIS